MSNAAGLRQRFPVFLFLPVHCLAVPLATLGRGIVFVRCSGGFGTVAKFFRLPIEEALAFVLPIDRLRNTSSPERIFHPRAARIY